MKHQAASIRTFIGAKDFKTSKQFYGELGFEEHEISADMSFFKINDLGFYLQDYYVKDWIDNSMVFLEVDSVARYWKELQDLGLQNKYDRVRLTPIKECSWGKECFMHDPSGVLWHFGEFYQHQKEYMVNTTGT